MMDNVLDFVRRKPRIIRVALWCLAVHRVVGDFICGVRFFFRERERKGTSYRSIRNKVCTVCCIDNSLIMKKITDTIFQDFSLLLHMTWSEWKFDLPVTQTPVPSQDI